MADKREPIKVDPGDTTELDNLAHLAAHGGDGRLFKMEQDYTKQVDEALLKARDLAQKDVVAAVESLKDIEKLTRLDADIESNTRVVQYMAKLCFEGQKWDLLMETIMTLSKKRLPINIAIAKMVRDAVAVIEKMPSEELKMKLIETLRTVTAGKIYVEVEHARLTSMVVKKLEAEGKLDEAATMLLELISNNIEFFNNSEIEDVQDLKLKYYELMIRIGLHDGNYLDVCRHHREIYETKKIKEDSVKVTYHLCSAVVYCLLAPHTNEQWDLLNRIAIQRELETVSDYKDILNLFINQKIISFKGTIVAKYEKLLRRGTTASPNTGIFDESMEGEKRWTELQLRVAEHSMKKIARDYTMISLERLSQLIGFSTDEIQTSPVSSIVRGYCMRILPNRPSQIVHLRWNKRNVEQMETIDASVKVASINIYTANSSSFLTVRFSLDYCFDVFAELSNELKIETVIKFDSYSEDLITFRWQPLQVGRIVEKSSVERVIPDGRCLIIITGFYKERIFYEKILQMRKQGKKVEICMHSEKVPMFSWVYNDKCSTIANDFVPVHHHQQFLEDFPTVDPEEAFVIESRGGSEMERGSVDERYDDVTDPRIGGARDVRRAREAAAAGGDNDDGISTDDEDEEVVDDENVNEE